MAAEYSDNMVKIRSQFVLDENQNRTAVLLPTSEWNKIVRDLKELDDIRACDAVLTEGGERLSFGRDVRTLRGYLKGIDTLFGREGERV